MRRRSSSLARWTLPAGAVVVATLGAALVYLAVAGPWNDSPAAGGPPPPGTTAVPILARSLPAFTRIEIDHLIDPSTGSLAAVHIPSESLLDSTITSPQELVGRVVASDKRAGQVFSENDLMPPGTRPGLVAGIPPGKRAVYLEAGRVSGLLGLRRGDRFDLMASGRSRGSAGRPGGVRGRPVVEGGVVVQPAQARRSLADGRIVEEVVVAVDPSEVAGLTAALEDGLRIDTLPHSGRAGAAASDRGYGDRAYRETAEVDLIRGTRRTVETTRGGPRPPRVSSGPKN
ncbi:MAG: Flp pilus assembly protein CpaB [Myxococcota bacterium]